MDDCFARLGLPRRWALDLTEVQAAHLRASRENHPDRFATAPEAERQAAEERMARINEACAQLEDPFLRARALLAYSGLETDKATDSRADPAFLMAMMEFKEEADDAMRAQDAESIQTMITRALAVETEKLTEVGKRLDSAEDADSSTIDTDGADCDLRPSALALLQEVAYFRKTRMALENSLVSS